MKNIYTLFTLIVIGTFSTKAQTPTQAPVRNNVEYKKSGTETEVRATSSAPEKKIKAPKRMMKEANFMLFSFPGKGTNYISVKDAMPNSHIKVVAYDVTGRLIFSQDYLANSFGQLVAHIDPMVTYTPGTAFVAALYNNQAYYESMELNK